MRTTVLFPIILCLVGCFAAKFPADLPRCHFGDVDCLKRVIENYAKTMGGGRRDLSLVPIDPLQVDEVSIIQGNTSPVNINLKFRDMQSYGLSTASVYKVIGFEKDPSTSKFEIYAKIPRITMVGQYKARGNILLLPIQGSGASNLTFENVDATIKFIPKVEVRKSKQYMRISNLILDFETSRLWMNFENLFNGDRLLSASTNQFLNDNWSDILKELKPVLAKSVGDIYKAILDPLFNKFPYEELFLADE